MQAWLPQNEAGAVAWLQVARAQDAANVQGENAMGYKVRSSRPARGRAMRIAAALMLGTAMSAIAVAPASAQQSDSSLRGTIAGGATSVTARQVATGFERTTNVESDGAFNFPSLRPGTYVLVVSVGSVTRTTDQFTLEVGQDAQLDFDFGAISTQPAQTSSTVDSNVPSADGDIIVTGSRLITVQGGEVGTNVSQRLIEQLPQNNRNFLAFADLAPGVQFVEGLGGQSRLQGGAQDSRTVNVFVDGVSQKDFVLRNGISGQDSSEGNPFPQLGVGEYRVISSNYKAEFDQVSSVAITAVTKSGTNEFHGEAFVDYTDQNLRDARPAELRSTTGKGISKVFQFGGALGGPIIKDLMHFFGTYEGKRIKRPVDFQLGGDVLESTLPTRYQGLFGQGNTDFTENLYFGKIDLVPTDADLFEVTAKYRDESGRSGGGGLNLQSTQTLTEVDELRLLGRWQHTADSWVNDLRVSYADVSWSPRPAEFSNQSVFRASQGIAPAPRTSFGLFTIGGGSNFQDKGQKGVTVQDDFTYTGLENHTFKVGTKVTWVKLNSLQQNLFNAQYTYDVNLVSQTGFNDTIPYQVRFGAPSGPGNSVVTSNNFQFGIYAQDDWDVTERLTLALGLRWDYERTPAYQDFVTPQVNIDAVTGPGYPNLKNANYNINDFISDGSNRKAFLGAFQPRIGFSYALDEAKRFTAFGGFGRSYDRNQFDFLQQEVSVGAYQVRTFNFIGANSIAEQNCAPTNSTCIAFDPIYLTPEGRAILAASSAGGGRELRFVDNNLKVPYSDQFSLGFRSKFTGFELEVGYTHIESRDGFVYLLGNRRPDGSFFFDNPASATDTPASPFQFTPNGFGSLLIGTNGLETTSDAGYVKFQKRYRTESPWSLDATYTYTNATENRTFGETFSLDYASIDDYPTRRSSGVPRHRFVAAGSVDTPVGITLSSRLTYQSPIYLKGFLQSAAPFTRDLIGVEAQSNGDRWGLRRVDFAATKYFNLPFLADGARVRMRIDVINAFNDRNYTNFNTNAQDSTRTPTSPTIFGERVPGTGINTEARTIKLSSGFSF